MIRSDKMMVGWPGVPGRSEVFEGAQCAPLRLRQETRIWGLPVYRAISVRGELYETNPSKAVNRLYTSHLRSKDRPRLTETMVVLVTYFSKDQSARLLSQHQEKLQKLRSEKIQQEMCSGIFGNMHTKSQKAMLRKMVTPTQWWLLPREHLQESSVHRHVVKTDASEKAWEQCKRLEFSQVKSVFFVTSSQVQSSIHRLYHQDLGEYLATRAPKKRILRELLFPQKKDLKKRQKWLKEPASQHLMIFCWDCVKNGEEILQITTKLVKYVKNTWKHTTKHNKITSLDRLAKVLPRDS